MMGKLSFFVNFSLINIIIMSYRHIKTIFFIATLGFVFSLFLAKTKTDEVKVILSSKKALWSAIVIKKNDLTNNLEMYDQESGEAKYVFRITIPLIMKVFGLSVFGMYLIQILIGFFIFVLWVSILYEIIKDYWLLLALTLCLAGCYYGKAFNIDSGTVVNTMSYFLILFAIRFRNNIFLLAPALLLLFFNDERGILAFSIIGLFILFFNKEKITQFKDAFNNSFITLLTCFVLGVLLRIYLMFVYKMKVPMGSIGFDVFQDQWKYLHLGLFSGISGFAILFFIQLKNEFKSKNFLFLCLNISVIFIFIIGASIVSDITKSIAYLTPLFLLMIWRMIDSKIEIKNFVYSILVINLFFPTIVVVGDKQFNYYNFSFDIIFKIHSIFI